MITPQFVNPCVCWWECSCFHVCAIMNKTAMNILVELFSWTCVFISLVQILGVKLQAYLVKACVIKKTKQNKRKTHKTKRFPRW